MSSRIYIFMAVFLAGCSAIHNQQMITRAGKNSVEELSSDEYSIIYNGKKMVLKNVVNIVWLNDEPYFELLRGNIMKWNKEIEIADNASSFNLQKMFNNIYFLKQYAAGAEPCSVSLNIIDSNGYKELVIKKDSKPEIFEEYFVRYPNEIYLYLYLPQMNHEWTPCFVLIDSVGNVIKTYDPNK